MRLGFVLVVLILFNLLTPTTFANGGEAIQANTKSSDLETPDLMSWICQGNQFYYQGEYSKALNNYESALEIDPSNSLALKCKGWTLQTMGRPEDAIESYEKVIDIDPMDYYAWINKGGAFYDQGKYEDAIEYYDNAIELDQSNPYAWNARGAASASLGNHEEALEYYEKALKLDPNYCLALNNKANSLIVLGRNIEAQNELDKARNLGENGCVNYGGLPPMDSSCASILPEDYNECNDPIDIGPILRADDEKTAYFEITVVNPLAIQSIDICANNGKIDFLDQVKEDKSYKMLLDDLTRVFEFAGKKLVKGAVSLANKEFAEYSGLVLKGAGIYIKSTSKPDDRETCRTLMNPSGIYGVRIIGEDAGKMPSANIKIWSNSIYCGQDISRYPKNYDIGSFSEYFLVSESIMETSAPRMKIEGLCDYCTECWSRPPIKVSNTFRSIDGKIAYFAIKELNNGGPAILRIRILAKKGAIDYAYQLEDKGRNEFGKAMGDILFELASIMNPFASPAKLAGEIVHERFTPEPTEDSKLDLLEPSGIYIVKLKARDDGESPEAELQISQMAPYCSGELIEWKEKKPVYYSEGLKPFLVESE